MHSLKQWLLALGVSLAMAGVAHAAPFQNGSFEDGPGPAKSGNSAAWVTTLGVGDPRLTGWTIGSGDIDYMDTDFWQAAAEQHSLDMSGSQAGAIAQTFDTVAGHSYEVSFALAGNPDGGAPAIKTLRVQATGGAATDYSFTPAGHSTSNMGWSTQTYAFTASGASTTLSFTSLANSNSGAALDAVDVRDVTVPAGTALSAPTLSTWAMLALAGLLVAFALRGRRLRA